MTIYQDTIAKRIPILKESGQLPADAEPDPRHIEASMLLQYGTLCHLPVSTFDEEILLFHAMATHDALSWEDVAVSYGL